MFQLLHLLEDLLQDRSLTLSGMPDLSCMVPLLCTLAEYQPKRVRLFNTKPGRAEVASSVFPVLAKLCTYPSHLDRRAQVKSE